MKPNFKSDWSELTDGVRVVELTGELDLAAADVVREQLLAAAGEVPLIIDISALEFLDSSGLSLLIAAKQRGDQAGHGMALVHGSKPGVANVLELSGVGERIGIHETVERARSSFSR